MTNLYDYTTEADTMDDGGDYYFEELREDNRLSIERDRRSRTLIGKYVIICDSRNDKGILYLQDQSISSEFHGHYWTKYRCNALGFDKIKSADARCNKLKYGNPRVRQIGPDLLLKIPRRASK